MSEPAYVIYGAPISLFTRKLEAAFRFYGAPHRVQAKTPDNAQEIKSRSGSHQVPVLQTPENWMIADTTPLIALLDTRFPARRLVPTGPVGVLVHVVEEVLDEWIARTMVHYRWHYAENTPFAAFVLALGRDHYATFVLGNARAVREGEKAFVVKTYGDEVSYLARPYPERSRQMIQARIRDQLDEGERAEVGAWLERWDLTECFMP